VIFVFKKFYIVSAPLGAFYNQFASLSTLSVLVHISELIWLILGDGDKTEDVISLWLTTLTQSSLPIKSDTK